MILPRGLVIASLRCMLFLGFTGNVVAQPIGYQAVPRDALPVFDNPTMLSAEEAEREAVIFPRDVVIGVRYGKVAKA